MMPLLESCLCLSLFTATIVFGAVIMIMYLLAFALELWWIIESYGKINATGWILCAGYLTLFFITVIMIAGIIGQKTRCIQIWIILIIIFFLPEAGFAIYMSVFQWKLSNTSGLMELILWIFRATINIFAVIVVQSQCSLWQVEKQVIKQLHLTETSVLKNSTTLPNFIHTKKSNIINVTKDLPTPQCYENYAFSSITEVPPTIIINNESNSDNRSVQRSLSSASQIHSPQKDCLYGGSLPVAQLEPHCWPPPHNIALLGHHPNQMSESGAIDYNSVVFPVDSNIELDPKSAVQLHSYRPRSLMYLDEDDYLTRPPPSRAVSMNYVNVYPAFSTQSLDRAKHFQKGDRKTTSLDFLDMTRVQGVRLQKLPMKPFDYLSRPGSKQTDIDSEDTRKIGDIAL